ncbi:MAG: DUF5011 domain-containing protein [Candidatus Pacearchaeota archaeon]
MKSKILFSIIFLTFLISSVSAVGFSLQYQGDTNPSKIITIGESVNIRVFGSSMHPPVSINVKLNSNQIYSESVSQDFEKIYTISPTTAGVYTIEVTATDGIESKTKTLSLTVNSPYVPPVTPAQDTTAPVISLIGSNPQTIIQGNAYTELGATASDNQDGDLTSRITRNIAVNTNVVGTHYVTYSVLDNAGNSGTATRTIYVVSQASIPDTTSPVITLIGNSNIAVEQGSSYTDAGATASDDRDGTITPILFSNNVNTNVLGTYQVVYRVSDSAGNIATATRTVRVVDTTAPSITITSPTNKTYTYSKDKKPMDFAFTIADTNLQNCWYKLNDEANVSFSCSLTELEDINVMTGQNTLTIYANDSAGNLRSNSVTFEYRYKKKSSGGSGGSSGYSTIISPITDVEPTGNVVIPITHITEKKENYLPLYLFMIATTSLGIAILSIILSRKLKEIKNNKNTTQNKIQEQPFY